jgi:hypothetical protein
MAQVRVAAGAKNLGADHAVAAVFMRDDVLLGHGPEKTGPAGAGIELSARLEQRQPAADAAVHTLPLVIQERAAERPLSALAAGDLELFWTQLIAPLRVGLDDARHLDGTDQLTLAVEDFDFHRRLLSDSEHACAV